MSGTSVAAVVLAAGEGKRLKSRLPKVLHKVAGKPLLAHCLDVLAGLSPAQVIAVVSPRRPEIEAALEGLGLEVDYVVQDPPRGTGDATRVGLTALTADVETVLVVNADLPLLRGETIAALLEMHTSSRAAATLLTADAPEGTDFGRIVRTASGNVDRIVEAADATPEDLAIAEANAGVYAFAAAALPEMLQRLTTENSQGELYLTDVVKLLRNDGLAVGAHKVDWEETMGINDREQLADASGALYERTARRWMAEGVTIVDPASTFIDSTVTIEADATILPFTFLEGETSVAAGAEVGPQARVVDSSIGAGASVSYSVVRGSKVGAEASVGPFASLRPGTDLGRAGKIGTFVETKATTIGEGSKAPHLSYLGDAEIGRDVNVGAGTITCNWDGENKNKTVIEDDAYISSDTMLVAPVRIGKRAATGAGSVVRDDVPDDALAVGVPARIIEGKGNRTKKKG